MIIIRVNIKQTVISNINIIKILNVEKNIHIKSLVSHSSQNSDKKKHKVCNSTLSLRWETGRVGISPCIPQLKKDAKKMKKIQ